MNRREIMSTLCALAKTSGRYGRIVEFIRSLTEADSEMLWNALEGMHFKDAVELVTYIEG